MRTCFLPRHITLISTWSTQQLPQTAFCWFLRTFQNTYFSECVLFKVRIFPILLIERKVKLRIFQLQTNLGFVCALIEKQSKTSHAYLFPSGTDHIDINMTHTTTSTNGFLLIYAYFSKCVLFKVRIFPILLIERQVKVRIFQLEQPTRFQWWVLKIKVSR